MAKISLFFALMANATGQVFLMIVLPSLGRQLDFSDMQTGAILSVSALLVMAAAPVWGYLSERIGRRPILMIGLAGAGLGPIAFSLIVAWRIEGWLGPMLALGLFFLARSIQSLITSALQPAAQAYIADVTPAGRRTAGMGLIGAAYGLGAIAGAALAWWRGNSPAIPFAVIAGWVGVAYVTMLLFVGEPERSPVQPAEERLSLAAIWPFLATTLIAFSSFSIVQQVIALRLEDVFGFLRSEAVTRAGAALTLTASAVVVVQGLVLGMPSTRPERLISIGTLLGAAAMLLCGLAQNYAQILGACVMFGLALGLVLPANLASLSLRSAAGAQGKAAGVNMVAQGSGLAIGPISGAALYQISPAAPFLTAASALLLGAGLAWHGCRQPVRRKPDHAI